VPEVVAKAIQNKLYKFVSVELLKNVKAHNRVIPWVLDAVALLGADQPAIGNLAELSALMASRRRHPVVGGTRIQFKRAFTNQAGGKRTMDEQEAQKLRDDMNKVLAAQATLASENAALKKTIEDRATADAAAAVEAKKEKIAARRKSIKDRFEDAIKATVLLPKHRDSFYATAGVDDDERVLKIEDKTIDSWLDDHKKSPEKGAQSAGGKGSEVKAKTWQGEVERRTLEKLTASGHKSTDYQESIKATKLVLREDPDLATKYFDDPNGSTEEAAA
jgi:hypothetical protein